MLKVADEVFAKAAGRGRQHRGRDQGHFGVGKVGQRIVRFVEDDEVGRDHVERKHGYAEARPQRSVISRQ